MKKYTVLFSLSTIFLSACDVGSIKARKDFNKYQNLSLEEKHAYNRKKEQIKAEKTKKEGGAAYRDFLKENRYAERDRAIDLEIQNLQFKKTNKALPRKEYLKQENMRRYKIAKLEMEKGQNWFASDPKDGRALYVRDATLDYYKRAHNKAFPHRKKMKTREMLEKERLAKQRAEKLADGMLAALSGKKESKGSGGFGENVVKGAGLIYGASIVQGINNMGKGGYSAPPTPTKKTAPKNPNHYTKIKKNGKNYNITCNNGRKQIHYVEKGYWHISGWSSYTNILGSKTPHKASDYSPSAFANKICNRG